MSTATLHQPLSTQPSAKTGSSQPAATTDHAPAPSRSAKADDGTRVLVALAGAATLVILVFFLAMMWWLSGYGPTV